MKKLEEYATNNDAYIDKYVDPYGDDWSRKGTVVLFIDKLLVPSEEEVGKWHYPRQFFFSGGIWDGEFDVVKAGESPNDNIVLELKADKPATKHWVEFKRNQVAKIKDGKPVITSKTKIVCANINSNWFKKNMPNIP